MQASDFLLTTTREAAGSLDAAEIKQSVPSIPIQTLPLLPALQSQTSLVVDLACLGLTIPPRPSFPSSTWHHVTAWNIHHPDGPHLTRLPVLDVIAKFHVCLLTPESQHNTLSPLAILALGISAKWIESLVNDQVNLFHKVHLHHWDQAL